MQRRYALILVLFGVALFLSGCDPMEEYQNKPVADLYRDAMGTMESGNYLKSAKIFEEIDTQHPSSEWAPKALVLSAYSYYMASSPVSKNLNHFQSAIERLESLMRVHPRDENIPYAMYLIALCYFEQLGDEMRDQQQSDKAVQAFQNLINRFPDTIYAKDARIKLEQTLSNISQKSFHVAKFQVERGEFAPAIKRLQQLLKKYPNFREKAEVYELLAISYAALGIKDLAEKAAKEAKAHKSENA